MKRIFTTVFLSFLTLLAIGQKSMELDNELDIKSGEIVKYLNLGEDKQYEVYKVLKHVKSRQEDVKLGHPKYKQIMGYINQERLDLMLILLKDTKLFKQYTDKYNSVEEFHINTLITKSNGYTSSYKEQLEDSKYLGKEETETETDNKVETK